MKTLLLKLGVALALSFAGYLYSQIRIKRIQGGKDGVLGRETMRRREEHCTKTPIDGSTAAPGKEEASPKVVENTAIGYPPSSKNPGEDEGLLLPEFNELATKELETNDFFPKKDVETPTFKNTMKDEMAMEQELTSLRNVARNLRERERNLEIQLLEYYGLKEQESAVRELQNRLKINSMEAKLFVLKIESLQAENRRLETQVSDHSRVVSELEEARAKIKLLKRKIRSDGENTRAQLSSLKQRIATLEDEERARNDVDVQKKIQRLKDLEEESIELRRLNSRLQSEVSDLAMKLETTQLIACSVLEVPGAEEALEEANQAEAALEEANHLRQANDDLAKEIERLQEDRYADAEELVYLKWINACLRYELRNYQAPPGKTIARDLSKSLSPKSEEKAKQLILEYANSGDSHKGTSGHLDFDSDCCSSSQDSTLTETGESDESSFYATSTMRSHSLRKTKFFSKLKRLVLGKDGQGSRLSTVDQTPKSCGNSDQRGSVSTRSYDDMMGYSYDSGSSSTTEYAPDNLVAPETKIGELKKRMIRSHSTLRPSLDIQRLGNPRVAEKGDMDRQRRHSDVGALARYNNKMGSGEGSAMDSLQGGDGVEQDRNLREKEELIKFAEVLKSSRGSGKSHRRSASFGEF